MPREKHFQPKLIAALESRGAYVTVAKADGIYTPSGTPDLICCYKGLYIAFECKHPGFKDPYKHLRPEQVVHLNMIRQAGGEAIAVNSIAVAMALLDEIDRQFDAA